MKILKFSTHQDFATYCNNYPLNLATGIATNIATNFVPNFVPSFVPDIFFKRIEFDTLIRIGIVKFDL